MRRGQGARKPRRSPGARPATSTWGSLPSGVGLVFRRALEAPLPGFLDGWRPARESRKGNGAEATRSRFLYLHAL